MYQFGLPFAATAAHQMFSEAVNLSFIGGLHRLLFEKAFHFLWTVLLNPYVQLLALQLLCVGLVNLLALVPRRASAFDPTLRPLWVLRWRPLLVARS